MKSVAALILLAVVALVGLGVWQRWQSAPAESASSASTTSAPRTPLAPEIAGDTWLNSAPLASEDLRGKVVVIEFWTFG